MILLGGVGAVAGLMTWFAIGQGALRTAFAWGPLGRLRNDPRILLWLSILNLTLALAGGEVGYRLASGQ